MALAISNTTKKSPFAVTSSGTPGYSTTQTNPTVKGNSAFSGLFSIGQQGQVVPKAAAQPTSGPIQRAPALQTAPTQASVPQASTPPLQTIPTAQNTSLTQPVRGVLSYPGFVGDLAAASRPSRAQEKLVSGIRDTAMSSPLKEGGAYDVYSGALSDLSKFKQSVADTTKGIYDAPTSARVMQGRDQAIQVANAAKEAALQQQVSQAQQALGYGIQEQQTQLGGLGTALGGANTQQQQQISGLGTAAGYAQPSTAPFGQTVFNPLTGQYEGGSGLDPQTQATNLAQQVMSGRMTYDQALSALGYAGQVGSNFLNNAITGAGGNPLQLQSQGAAQQSNIQTSGTAQTDIARQGLGQATQDYVQMTGAAQFAGQQADAVKDILTKTGLNNVSSTDYTKVLNNLQGRFSSSDFVALNTALREAQIAYTNLLSTGGGTPTGNEENALATLNVNQSASAIKASIGQLENAVARRLQALESVRSQYEQNLGGGSSSYNGGGTATGGAGTITWDSLGD